MGLTLGETRKFTCTTLKKEGQIRSLFSLKKWNKLRKGKKKPKTIKLNPKNNELDGKKEVKVKNNWRIEEQG